MIRIIMAKDYEEVGKKAADVIANVVLECPTATLGLATGSSPISTYKNLIKRCESGELSFKNVRTVNLDEYYGLDKDHDQSYRYFMNENLFNHIDIDKANTHLPNGKAADPKEECKRYDAVIESMGGVDVQVLGIGHNGHIGFNEPADSFSKGVCHVTLTESTINANARFFADKSLVPTSALSMGIGQIMAAKKILMVANGEAKAEILEKAFFGEVTPAVPASILQFFSGECVLVADEAALSLIRKNHPDFVFG